MASNKKKKYKKKPQQFNKNNTTKKPQKEGFFARRERLNKEKERREKVAAMEAERSAKQARLNEEKERREKLRMERQQAKTVTEPAAEPIAQAVTEPVVEPVAEPIAETVTEPIAESVNESVFDYVAEPAAEMVIEPVEEPDTECVTEQVAEPVYETVTEPLYPQNPDDNAKIDEAVNDEDYIPYSRLRKEKAQKTAVVPEKKLKAPKKNSFKDIFKDRKKLIIIIAAVLVVVVGVVIALIIHSSTGINALPKEAVPVYRGAKAHVSTVRDISIDAKEENKRIHAIKMKGDTDKFKFYCFILDTLEINEWYTPFEPCFANSKDNDCILIISIFNEENELLYRSLGLEPGKYIPNVKLFEMLDYGTYKCKLCVAAYDTKTFENIGVQYKDFTLTVGIEGENETEQDSTEERTTLPATKPATTVGTTADQTEATAATVPESVPAAATVPAATVPAAG
ncbi:MAG: hypothetical protein K5756_01295 [Clostridiales bacterium]|nr:hypothetical protein [Clostridiales bacterium]